MPSSPSTRSLSSSWPHVDGSLIFNERYTRLSTLDLNERKKKKNRQKQLISSSISENGEEAQPFHFTFPCLKYLSQKFTFSFPYLIQASMKNFSSFQSTSQSIISTMTFFWPQSLSPQLALFSLQHLSLFDIRFGTYLFVLFVPNYISNAKTIPGIEQICSIYSY